MANPYKNTKKSPLHQDGGKWMTTTYDSNLQNISKSERAAYNKGQNEALGFASTFLPVGGGALAAVKHGKKALNFFKKAWNYGKKGGFGYQPAVSTGKPFTQHAVVSYKNWAGKQHEFKNLQKMRITKSDITKNSLDSYNTKKIADIATGKNINLPAKITGTLGRGTVIGGAVVAGGNEFDRSLNEVRTVAIDNLAVKESKAPKIINETFKIRD